MQTYGGKRGRKTKMHPAKGIGDRTGIFEDRTGRMFAAEAQRKLQRFCAPADILY